MGCAPTTGLALREKMARMATSYCTMVYVMWVLSTGGDPRMIARKRVIVCYKACTVACNQPNRGETKIRELEITDSYYMVAALWIGEWRFLNYWQGCR